MGPQILECIKSRIPIHLLSLLRKIVFENFPIAHVLYMCHRALHSTLEFRITVSLRNFNAPWCICPICLCHNSLISLLLSLLTSTFGVSNCNLYKLSLLTPICFAFFQSLCFKYTLSPLKEYVVPFVCNGRY